MIARQSLLKPELFNEAAFDKLPDIWSGQAG
jgi:hypothetical protein